MSDTTLTATLENDAASYMRLVFTIYWRDSPPSAEVFFLWGHPSQFTLAGIALIEADVIALMQLHDLPSWPHCAIYLSSSNVEMTGDEIVTAGWKLLQAS